MKSSILLKAILIFYCGICSINAQQYDTIFHTNNQLSYLNFQLADTKPGVFQITTREIKKLDGDTVQIKVSVDTFFVQRILSQKKDIFYKYSISKRMWLKQLLGRSCKSHEHLVGAPPEFIMKLNQENHQFEFINCEENAKYIKNGFLNYLQCIDTLEDKYMLKHVKEWSTKTEECDFQKSMFLLDLGHIVTYLNFPIPSVDSIVNFSLVNNEDTTGLLSVHYYTKMFKDDDTTSFLIGEDLSKSKSAEEKMRGGMYSLFKDHLSVEEQNRDSIRISSIKETDLTTLYIDNNMYINKYERYRYSSILNSDMKTKESEYLHVIERVEN